MDVYTLKYDNIGPGAVGNSFQSENQGADEHIIIFLNNKFWQVVL